MTNKQILILVAVLAAAGLIYWKFFHHKRAAHMEKKPSTPAVAKHGGGGWRHRLSHFAGGIAKTALASSGIPGASAAGQIAGL